MIFETISTGNTTVLHFTHDGLVPEKERYAICEKGWSKITKDWLRHFIKAGIPPEGVLRATGITEIKNQNFKKKTDMEHQNYQKTIIVNASAKETMKKISQISCWWKKDFMGSAENLNDQFTVPFTKPSFVDFVVSEWVPDKKVVWKVTDCFLPWFQDKKEWNHTEVVFQLSEENGKTTIDFTHIGLVPEVECYEICEKGWNGHIETLVRFINQGEVLTE